MASDQEILLYNNIPNLKAANVPMQFEKWQIEELIKCKDDPIYFIEKYVKVVHVDRGLVPMMLYPFQKRMVETIVKNRFSIGLVGRQMGKSTGMCSAVLHYIIFNERKTVAILANKASTAGEIFSRVKEMYINLPMWMQVGVVKWNERSCVFGNGTKVITGATSPSAIRGNSISMLVLDEYAFIPTQQADEFYKSVYPTISSGKESKLVIFSTPNGMNHYYKMWMDAKEGRSKFVTFDAKWNEVPGRDEEFRQTTIDNTSIETWLQEYECEFMGSTGTLISGSALRNLVHKSPINDDESMRIFEAPVQGRTYFCAVDVARGGGGDYTVIQVIDITELPYKQVAVYHNNRIAPLHLPQVIANVARRYNEAYVLVEINDIGESVADDLVIDQEYENVLTTSLQKNKVRLGGMVNAKNGLRTTKSTKNLGCSMLKSMIEDGKLIINDFPTIQEFSNFVSKAGSYMAEAGAHDDLVMALVVFAWASGQDYFRDLVTADFKGAFQADHASSIDEAFSPIGFVCRGDEDDGVPITVVNRW